MRGARVAQLPVDTHPRQIVFESKLEEDFLKIALTRGDIYDIWDQPPAAVYTDRRGKVRTHTFDYLITFKSGKRITAAIMALSVGTSFAGGDHDHNYKNAVKSPVDSAKTADFDIVKAHVAVSKRNNAHVITFKMKTAGTAGEPLPIGTGQFSGAPIWAYVWPTSLNPSAVGFEADTGILALAATNHPDFDDTPLFDKNVDGDTDNDGAYWHSHWVVLTLNEACGPGALGVRDIAESETPNMPATWPGVPFFLDSPSIHQYLMAQKSKST